MVTGLSAFFATLNTGGHFSPDEFSSHGFPAMPTAFEEFLLKNMVENILLPIREKLNMPIHISDCARTFDEYNAMLARGLNPSPKSDHFWGKIVPTVKPTDRVQFGTDFRFSVGAVDFTVDTPDMRVQRDIIAGMVNLWIIKVGQLIIEKTIVNGKVTKQWIHISNPRSLVYSSKIVTDLGLDLQMMLASNNGGATYEAIA